MIGESDDADEDSVGSVSSIPPVSPALSASASGSFPASNSTPQLDNSAMRSHGVDSHAAARDQLHARLLTPVNSNLGVSSAASAGKASGAYGATR